MRAAAALLALVPALALGGAPDGPRAPLDLRLVPRAKHGDMGGTRCELCHTEAGWEGAAFPHDRTGFPLTGRHQKAGCRECHAQSLSAPLPRTCGGCHRDVHRGQLGMRCDGCHQTDAWTTTFAAEAHRRTNFPLSGAHALVPCQECHADQRGRTFSRATTACIGCHQPEYQRTALTSIDHQAAGFSTDCRQCHGTWRFRDATLAGHDACFQISRGTHAGIRCPSCHTSLASAVPNGTCSTGTAACSSCHEHSCDRTDREHTGVPGYQCKDLKCYSCHRFTVGR